MTDIYVNRPTGKRKWIIGIVFLVVIALALWRWKSAQSDSGSDSGSTTEQSLPDTDDASGSETEDGPEAVSPHSNASAGSLSGVEELMSEGKWLEARKAAFEIRSQLPEGMERRQVERLLGTIHTELVFSKRPMPEKTVHQVKSGDILGTIAQKYGTTPERISAINGIERNIIRIGESLQILQGDFRVEVSKSRNEMEVYLNDRFFKRYRVGTGTDSSTPTGEYVITLRMKHPVWYRPDGKRILYGDPENLLGTHYLKLNTPGIGLHGTWEPDSVGSQSSAGCVRLINEEIKELYELLPEGTPVIITD